MPDGSKRQNKQEQNKYIGRKKIVSRAEFEEAQMANFENKPLELNKTAQGSETIGTDQPKPDETPNIENAQKPPVENFNPQMDEPPPPKQSPDNTETQAQQSEQNQESSPENQSKKDNPENQNQSEDGQNQSVQENQRKKLTDRAKEFYIQKKKALIEGVKKRFSKAGMQAAGKAIWAFIVAFWPYILGALAVIFILLMIASSCSKQTGKTPTQPLDKVKDKTLVLKTLATSGDKASQRQLYIDGATTAKGKVAKLPTSNADAKKIIDQINQLLDEIITLSDNTTALTDHINRILALLDQLKNILKDQATLIDEIKAQMVAIQKMIDLYQNARLILNPKDADYIRNFEADRRIVQMLLYLVTPIDQNGAGHERIRVKRIKFSYDTENKSLSKETDYSDKDEPNVSAHYTGQAADISEVDCIKCTEIKRVRLGHSSKSAQPPTPIKVAWQSEEGYAKAGGPQAYGNNMHQVFNNLSSGATSEVLIAQISDILGIELDPDKIKGKNFNEISRYVGNAVLKETLGIPGDYEMGNNLGDIASATGQAYVAKALGVPIDGVKGNSPDEISQNVGRATIEGKMLLPEGSLEGNNSNEIFASVGRRLIENSLGLSKNSLGASFSDSNSFRRVIGQGKVEASLGLKPQTFYGASLNEIIGRIGKDAYETTFANPETIDNWLGIPTGTTEKLITEEISPDSYNKIVGDKVYDNQIGIYQRDDKRAEVFGISAGEMNALTAGNQSILVSIGRTTISHLTTSSDEEQAMMRQWFDTGTKPDKLDADYIGGQYALRTGDFEKIFVDNLAKQVFERIGQTAILNNLSNDPKIGAYVQPIQDYQFYSDRLHLIKDDFDYLEKNSADPEIKAKANETKTLIDNMLKSPSINEAKKNTKQIQANVKFIENKAKSDPTTAAKIKEIKKAVNEIIEGKEIPDFDTLSADTVKAKTDPQAKLTKKDLLDVLTGKKKIDDVIYAVGLRKWEIELDLPDGSLQNAYGELKKTDFRNADNTLLSSIGKTRLDEYGGIEGKDSAQVDKDLGLPSGTTASYRAKKITENAYWQRIGMSSTNNVAAKILNRQLDLTNSPFYALEGTDVTKMLNGGWFMVALKVSGRSVDESLGFPEGGTLDIIQQTNKPGDAMQMLAEKKLGQLAGLDRAVSLGGDIPYNLGRVKIEQTLGLQPNELNDGNLINRIKGYTGSDVDSLSRLDMTLGLEAWTSQALVEGGVNPHDYILKTGNATRDNAFYDQLARYAPTLKNQDVKNAVITLTNQTGTPSDIFAEAGAGQVGQALGLNYPVSIRGNFKDNLGAAKVEDRLGLLHNSFQENIDAVINLNGKDKFASAFYVETDELNNARKANSGYWSNERQIQANQIDALLNIPSGNTKDFLTGAISLPEFVGKVGQNSLTEVSVEKLADVTGVEEKYQTATKTLVDVFNEDPTFSSPQSQQKLFGALSTAGGWNLDDKTKFDPGTWQKILIYDPADPNGTGLQNADTILLEQGKKWLPRWMGMDEKYDSYIDIVYEQALQSTGQSVYNEQALAQAIQDTTGIPADSGDAYRFVNGDIKGGLTAWGAAQMVKTYNNEFNNTGDEAFKLDYATAKKAYFNDIESEDEIANAAIVQARKDAGGEPLDATAEKTIGQEAIRQARDNARKDLQYRAVDIQLHKANKNIPAGFTQAMREGTPEQKWGMGLNFVGNMVHSKNPEIPAEIAPDLEKYFDPNSASFHDPKALSDTSYSFLDGKLTGWMGDFVQPGTAKALFQYGQTGKLGSPQDQGSLTQIYADYGTNVVTNWADKQSGLPMGTTKLAYDYFVKYQAALGAYQKAQAVYAATLFTGDGTKTAEALKNLNKSEAVISALKAEAISTVITMAFQKQLLAADQKLGLVPGSSSMLVGMGVEMWLTGAVSPWTIGIFVLTNLFGVYRVDVTCTACGYYPEMGAASSVQPCPLGEFDGKSADAFKTNSLAAAQWKVNQVINDVLQMPKALNDKNLVPTQIMTYRQDDVDSFGSTLNDLYGAAGVRGNSGLWANELMWDHIHIGY
ncbi:MAG: hypothetical protein M1429_01675 [Patescibacteria group bacterium]|nr:hypothetical protein [Patescibacteria group bacterium]